MQRSAALPKALPACPRRIAANTRKHPIASTSQVTCRAVVSPYGQEGDGMPEETGADFALTNAQRYSLTYSARCMRRWGWAGFWLQLALSLVSTGILFFSVAFTTTKGPRISLYMTLFAIIAGYFSTFWSYGYTRLARKVKRYADVTEGGDVQAKMVKKKAVRRTLHTGMTVNVIGMGAGLLSLQAMVGMLVAKTLTSASVNPFFSSTGPSQINPVVALDVFMVQAATNALLSHFAALVMCFLLLRAVER